MTDNEDSILISKAKRGDFDAFGTLIEKYNGELFGLGKKYNFNRNQTDEVLQNTRIKAYRNIHKFKADNFRGWLGTIFCNTAKDYLSHEKVESNRKLDVDEDVWSNFQDISDCPSKTVENQDWNKYISLLFNKASKSLSQKHRKIVQTCLIDGLTYADASKRLKIKRGTIMSGLHYAKEHLKRRMEPFLNK